MDWADYPRAADRPPQEYVGRAEILEMAGLPPGPSSQAWWRSQIHHQRFPAANGPDVDGMPTWRRRTMLWHLNNRENRVSGADYLSPALKAEAARLADEFPDEYTDLMAGEHLRRVGRRLASKVRPGSRARDPMTMNR